MGPNFFDDYFPLLDYLYGMIQSLVIVLLFLGAASYLGLKVIQAFQAKHACSGGCAKCVAVDFAKIEKQISASESAQKKI